MDRYRNIPVTDVHGFQLARQPTRLHAEDFDSPSMVENEYFPEVEAYLRKFLRAEDVRVMQSAVRERPLGFLETGGGVVKGDRRKPLPGVHSVGVCINIHHEKLQISVVVLTEHPLDTSPQGAVKCIQSFGLQRLSRSRKGDFKS